MANLLKVREYVTSVLNREGAKTLNEHVADYSLSALSESVDSIVEGRKDYTAHAVDTWMKRKESGYQKRKNAEKDKKKIDEAKSGNIFDKHLLKIAKDTLKMSDVGARIMGGMTKEEARKHIHRITGKYPKETNESINEGEVKTVYNKLLGGWYNVRGKHQTPLGGRFDSKEAAVKHLNRNKKPANESVVNEEFEGHIHALHKFLDMTGGQTIHTDKFPSLGNKKYAMARHHARMAISNFKSSEGASPEYKENYLKNANKHLAKVEYHINRIHGKR